MIDPLTMMMLAILALMVVFMIRNSRKQKADREALVSQVVKGANVMTASGIFGTIVSLDEHSGYETSSPPPGGCECNREARCGKAGGKHSREVGHAETCCRQKRCRQNH
jgi:preprotein translocase YajC subunit